MDREKFGTLIREFDTSLSNIIFKRMLNWALIILVSVSVVLLLNLAEAGIQSTFPNLTSEHYWLITAAIALLTFIWMIYRLFLRKMYHAKLFKGGLVLTEKKRNTTREFLFDEIHEIEVVQYNKDFKKIEAIIHFSDNSKIVLKTDEFYQLKEFCISVQQISNVNVRFDIAAEVDVV